MTIEERDDGDVFSYTEADRRRRRLHGMKDRGPCASHRSWAHRTVEGQESNTVM